MNATPSRSNGLGHVVAASSVGTMIEFYDFFIFASLASVLVMTFIVGTVFVTERYRHRLWDEVGEAEVTQTAVERVLSADVQRVNTLMTSRAPTPPIARKRSP